MAIKRYRSIWCGCVAGLVARIPYRYSLMCLLHFGSITSDSIQGRRKQKSGGHQARQHPHSTHSVVCWFWCAHNWDLVLYRTIYACCTEWSRFLFEIRVHEWHPTSKPRKKTHGEWNKRNSKNAFALYTFFLLVQAARPALKSGNIVRRCLSCV